MAPPGHFYSEYALERHERPQFSLFGKMRHPFKYIKYKIQESTAPDIPLDDVIFNEQIHNRIE